MNERLFGNMRHWIPSQEDTEGKYNIPKIEAGVIPEEIQQWVPFNNLKRRLTKKDGVQMYVDDYRIDRLWYNPDKYIEGLRNAGAVLSCDFSIYADIPVALGIYNHFRKHWLGAYYQQHGLNVIPTICWGEKKTFDWCFDGEPTNAPVSVSSVGTQRNAESKRGFMLGYDAMLERLNPSIVLFFGKIPAEARGNILPAETFYTRFEKAREEKR